MCISGYIYHINIHTVDIVILNYPIQCTVHVVVFFNTGSREPSHRWLNRRFDTTPRDTQEERPQRGGLSFHVFSPKMVAENEVYRYLWSFDKEPMYGKMV